VKWRISIKQILEKKESLREHNVSFIVATLSRQFRMGLGLAVSGSEDEETWRVVKHGERR